MGATALIAGGALYTANAINSAGKMNQQIANHNAELSEAQAQDALAIGAVNEQRQRAKTKQLIGSQRANLAAQGIDIETGSALDVQTGTAALGEDDALMIRTNAAREAWGYRAQASNYRFGGEVARTTAKQQAVGTLLTGGGKAYGNYSTLNKT